MKISVVTTMYNIENYIKECLDSLCNQTYKNLEIILVNDCSTDRTMEIVNEYEDDRIVVINHEENMGAGQARKTGIEAATGDYIITIDGDDWVSDDFIEILVNKAIETNSDIVSGGITTYYDEQNQKVVIFNSKTSKDFEKFQDYLDGRIVFLNNKLVKRKMYDLVPYSTRRFCEDTPVIIPLLYYANSVSYANTQGYFYRQHDQSLCHKTDNFKQTLYKALCCKDLINFFSDKEEEYRNIISIQELIDYLFILKQEIELDTTLIQQYQYELGELIPVINKYIFNR